MSNVIDLAAERERRNRREPVLSWQDWPTWEFTAGGIAGGAMWDLSMTILMLDGQSETWGAADHRDAAGRY